MSTISNTNY